jgi:hypothetical protein
MRVETKKRTGDKIAGVTGSGPGCARLAGEIRFGPENRGACPTGLNQRTAHLAGRGPAPLSAERPGPPFSVLGIVQLRAFGEKPLVRNAVVARQHLKMSYQVHSH